MVEHLNSQCPTCGQDVPDYPFKVGERVRHFQGYEGTVEKVGFAVHVRFDPEEKAGIGMYDAAWFKAWPTGLTKI